MIIRYIYIFPQVIVIPTCNYPFKKNLYRNLGPWSLHIQRTEFAIFDTLNRFHQGFWRIRPNSQIRFTLSEVKHCQRRNELKLITLKSTDPDLGSSPENTMTSIFGLSLICKCDPIFEMGGCTIKIYKQTTQ